MTVNERKSRRVHPRSEKGSETDKSAARRVWIMRGLVTPILGMLAVTCIVLGILNATVWKPSRSIAASTRIEGTQYIATDPGVLPLVDQQVELTVESSGSDDVCVALGSGKDVNGWVAGESYVRVTGLHDWSTLSTETFTSKSSSDASSDSSDDQSGAVAFRDSDMWSKVECGKGSAKLSTETENATTMAIVDLGAKSDATVTLHWVRDVLPDFAMPFYFAGGLLVIMAILTASLFAMPPHKRRKRIVESVVHEEVSVAEALSGSLSAFKPSGKPKRKRSRHAAHRPGASSESVATTSSDVPSVAVSDDTTGSHDVSMTFPSLSEPSQPTIIDPSARNLVADQVAANAADHDDHADHVNDHTADAQPSAVAGDTSAEQPSGNDEATSVITPDELQAYFARLAQETSDDHGEEAHQ